MNKIDKIKEVIGKIKGNLFKEANRVTIGTLKSKFKGNGIQFKDHRVYAHGDDLRQLDWNALAKNQMPYIKTFEEERNLEVVVVLDLSLSMFYGLNNITKLQVAIELSCLLSLVTEITGDFIQIYLFGENVVKLDKSKGEKGIFELFCSLQKMGVLDNFYNVNLDYRPNVEMKHEKKQKEILKVLKNKKELILFSDFHNFLSEKSLEYLKNTRHCNLFQIFSPLDQGHGDLQSVFFTNATDFKVGHLGKIENKNYERNDYGKIKKIFVHENYMEKFLKELI
jgi:hypothetical protein